MNTPAGQGWHLHTPGLSSAGPAPRPAAGRSPGTRRPGRRWSRRTRRRAGRAPPRRRAAAAAAAAAGAHPRRRAAAAPRAQAPTTGRPRSGSCHWRRTPLRAGLPRWALARRGWWAPRWAPRPGGADAQRWRAKHSGTRLRFNTGKIKLPLVIFRAKP